MFSGEFMSIMPVAVISIVVVIVVFGAVYYQRKGRRFWHFAVSHGFTLTERDSALGQFVRDHAKVAGRDHIALNVVEHQGASDSFQYGNLRWRTRDAQEKVTHSREFFLSPIAANFPPTHVSVRGGSDPSGHSTAAEPMEFSTEWDVSSDDAHFSSILLTPDMREFFKTSKGGEFYLFPGYLLIMGASYSPENSLEFRDEAARWRSLIPSTLWREYGT